MTKMFEITVTQAGMADAIEHWLNTKVLKHPCKVTTLQDSRAGKSTTWKIVIEEPAEVVGMPVDHDRTGGAT